MLKCDNLFCEHPVLLGFGFLIVAILVILLLFEPFDTKDPNRGKGGGKKPDEPIISGPHTGTDERIAPAVSAVWD